jgi:hypothetical protein
LDGKPAYFVMPKDADDGDVRAEAFRIRNGRDLSMIEESLIRIVERDIVHVES